MLSLKRLIFPLIVTAYCVLLCYGQQYGLAGFFLGALFAKMWVKAFPELWGLKYIKEEENDGTK